MSQSITHLTPEELLWRTNWVRKLARSMAMDEAQAEDLAQEILLKQVERPTTQLEGVRDWLRWTAVTARNLNVTNLRRDQGQRHTEERRTRERPTTLPSPHEMLEMEDERQALVRMVRALPEPFLTTILLHYFESTTAKEIATQLGLPLSTVTSRISRGLELLRIAVEKRQGPDWRNHCLALAMPTGLATSTKAGAGALGGAKLWITATLLLASGGVAIWTVAQSSNRSLEGPASGVAEPETIRSVSLEGDLFDPRESEEALAGGRVPQAESVAASAAADSAGILVHGTVRDQFGLPLGADRVVFRHEDGTVLDSRLSGSASYAIARLSPGNWTAEAQSGVARALPMEFTLDDQSVVELDLRLEAPSQVPLRLSDMSGQSCFKGRVKVPGLRSKVKVEWLATTDRPAPVEPQSGVLATEFDVFGRLSVEEQSALSRDALGRLSVASSPPFFVSAVVRGHVLATGRVDAPGEELHLRVDPGSVAQLCGSLSVTVIDRDTGTGIEGATALLISDDAPLKAVPDAPGTLELAAVLPGSHELRVLSKGHATRQFWIEVQAGQLLDLGQVELGQERRVSGKLLDSEGRPVKGSIRALPLSEINSEKWPSSTPRVTADDQGEFVLIGAASERLLLLPAAYVRDWTCEPLVVDASAGDLSDVVFTLHRGVRVRLKLESQHAPTSYRILRGDLPMRLDTWGTGPQIDLRLLPGEYRVRAEDSRGSVLGEASFDVGDQPTGLLELEL